MDEATRERLLATLRRDEELLAAQAQGFLDEGDERRFNAASEQLAGLRARIEELERRV